MRKMIARSTGMLILALIFFGMIIHPATSKDDQDWPQFHFGPEHLGEAASAAPHSNQTLWVSGDIGAQEGSSVSVANGLVFVNCMDHIACLNKSSGQAIWNTSFETTPDAFQIWGFSPVYDKGRVFLSALKTVCLNASDGKEIWSYSPPTGKGAVNGGAVSTDGRVLTGDWDGHNYYCLDEYTGKELWNFTVSGNAQSTPAVSGGKVILSGWDWGKGGNVYCLNLDSGQEIWNISLENLPCGTAALTSDVAYLTTYNFEGDGDVMAISLQDGKIIWKKSIYRTDCTAAVAGSRLYVCGGVDGYSDKATYCFDASTGDLIWKTPEDEGIGEWRCSPAYADGQVFVGKTENMDYVALYALNANTGETIWSYPAGGSAPVVADGMLFTIGSGRVYAFGGMMP